MLKELKGIVNEILYDRRTTFLNNKLHLINDILIRYGYFLKVYTIQKKFRYLNIGDQKKMKRKQELTSCAHPHRCLKYCFDTVVKINNYQLTQEEKEDFHIFADFNPQNKKVSHCYFCEFPLECKVLNRPEKPTRECSRLDFVIRKEYQFVKNIFSQKNIFSYYKALTFRLKAYEFLAMQADHSVMIDEKKIE